MDAGRLVWKAISAVIAAGFLFVSLSLRDAQPKEFSVVAMQGIDAAQNYMYSGPFVQYGGIGEGSPALLLRDGDLFTVSAAGDPGGDYMSVYRGKDGTRLVLSEGESFLLFQNNIPVSLNLDGAPEESPWNWLAAAPDADIRALRFIQMIQTVPDNPAELRALLRVARLNPHIGLALDSSQIKPVLAYFKPDILYLQVSTDLSAEELYFLSQQKQVGTLVLFFNSAEYFNFHSVSFLREFTRLRRMVIMPDADISGFPFWPPNLRFLSISSAVLRDLSSIKDLKHLQDLSLDCRLDDVGGLAGFSKLVSLNLTGSEGVRDISPVGELRGLKYLGLPRTVSQESFVSLTQSLKGLEMLQLFETSGISDARPLLNMPRLNKLIIVPDDKAETPFRPDMSVLAEMKNLKYLALGKTLVADTAAVDALSKKLPECRIVSAEGLCLGSGWILLLLLPVIFSIRKHD